MACTLFKKKEPAEVKMNFSKKPSINCLNGDINVHFKTTMEIGTSNGSLDKISIARQMSLGFD